MHLESIPLLPDIRKKDFWQKVERHLHLFNKENEFPKFGKRLISRRRKIEEPLSVQQFNKRLIGLQLGYSRQAKQEEAETIKRFRELFNGFSKRKKFKGMF